MLVSDLMQECIEYMKDYGDGKVYISILTENGNYEFEPCASCGSYKTGLHIEMDVENVKEFKKNLI